MNTLDRWLIICRKCEDQTEAIYEHDTFFCKVCGTDNDPESTSGYNVADMEYHRRTFIGAKIAGMIPDPEFEGDREQQARERW